MREPKEVSQLKLAAQVSRHVQIEEVRLIRASARRSPGIAVTEGEMAIFHRLHETTFKQKGADLIIEIRFGLQGVGKDDPSRKLFELSAAFELTYKLDRETTFPAAQLRGFSSVNGAYNAWPYWREFVQNTAVRMGLPRLVVPVFRVPRRPKSEKGPDQEATQKPPPAKPEEHAPRVSPEASDDRRVS
jgi:hypothetical protein